MGLQITKTDYLSFKQCPKSLWLRKHKPDVINKSDENGMDTIEQIRELAGELFPFGVYIESENVSDKIIETQKAISQGEITIFGAAFEYKGLVVLCDVLHSGDEGWTIYKVTSSTGVKERQMDDIGFQYFVANKTMPIHSVHIAHLNKEYVRNGELNLDELFVITNKTEEVLKKQEEVTSDVVALQGIVKNDSCEREIGGYCDKYGKDALPCAAKGHCWSHIPTYSVFNITRIGKKAMDLYKDGIVKIEDIPEDFKLSETQKFQVETHKSKKSIVEKEKIKEFLRDFTFPLYFLDFETYQQTIPLYNGVKPYQQIPFQYSLHILKTFNEDLEHREFLAKEGVDSRRVLAERLIHDIPKDVCVVAYNMSFEKMVLKGLAEQFQDLSDHLMSIHDNIVDLMIPFQKKWYYTNEMQGSYSIKYVLPALLPNDESLDYKNLTIQNGSMAMDIYAKLHTFSPEEVENIREDLLAYCKLDTYAMVKIWEVLYYI